MLRRCEEPERYQTERSMRVPAHAVDSSNRRTAPRITRHPASRPWPASFKPDLAAAERLVGALAAGAALAAAGAQKPCTHCDDDRLQRWLTLHSPGLMMPGQLGPISRVLFCSLMIFFTRTMSCCGMPSVMHTARGISASTASRMACGGAPERVGVGRTQYTLLLPPGCCTHAPQASPTPVTQLPLLLLLGCCPCRRNAVLLAQLPASSCC